jgi:hypothetical protein
MQIPRIRAANVNERSANYTLYPGADRIPRLSGSRCFTRIGCIRISPFFSRFFCIPETGTIPSMSGLAHRFGCLRATDGISGFDAFSRIGIRGTVSVIPWDRHPNLPSERFLKDWQKLRNGKFGCQSPGMIPSSCMYLCPIMVVSTN